MERLHLKALLAGEKLDIARIAGFCNTQGTATGLLLQQEQISHALKAGSEGRQAYLFRFGGIVFINFTNQEMQSFLDFLLFLEQDLDERQLKQYIHDYHLEISPSIQPAFSFHHGSISSCSPACLYALSSVLVHSLLLDRIQKTIDELIDQGEILLTRIRESNLFTSRIYL